MALQFTNKMLQRCLCVRLVDLVSFVACAGGTNLHQIPLRDVRPNALLCLSKAWQVSFIECLLFGRKPARHRRSATHITDVVADLRPNVQEYSFTCVHLQVEVLVISLTGKEA